MRGRFFPVRELRMCVCSACDMAEMKVDLQGRAGESVAPQSGWRVLDGPPSGAKITELNTASKVYQSIDETHCHRFQPDSYYPYLP